MFNVGFWELIIILIVALIVIKPSELPKVAHEIGKWMRKLQRLTSSYL